MIFLLLSLLIYSSTSTCQPAIVCDAGSTGTRIYAFSTSKEDNVKVILLGKIQPGLAAFATEGKLDALLNELVPIVQSGVAALGFESLPLYLLGTGGVRGLSKAEQGLMWDSIKTGLEARNTTYAGNLFLEAIEGTAEAFYGLVSANHILGKSVGVWDLGGSSVELAHAGQDRLVGTADDVLVTYSGLGTEKMRSFALEECVHGSGGLKCREKIKSVLDQRGIGRDLSDGSREYVAISAFVYSLDFADFILEQSEALLFKSEYPTPSVLAVREACEAVCLKEVDIPLFTKHPMTNSIEAHGRCFDVCFVAELMTSFGLGEEERRVSFLKDFDGKEVEWTLGYYLTHVLKTNKIIHDEL